MHFLKSRKNSRKEKMIKIEDFTKEEIVAALKARFPFSLNDMLYYCIQKKI